MRLRCSATSSHAPVLRQRDQPRIPTPALNTVSALGFEPTRAIGLLRYSMAPNAFAFCGKSVCMYQDSAQCGMRPARTTLPSADNTALVAQHQSRRSSCGGPLAALGKRSQFVYLLLRYWSMVLASETSKGSGPEFWITFPPCDHTTKTIDTSASFASPRKQP